MDFSENDTIGSQNEIQISSLGDGKIEVLYSSQIHLHATKKVYVYMHICMTYILDIFENILRYLKDQHLQ